MRKVTVFNFITLNGYFQGPDGDISWHRHEADGMNKAEKIVFSRTLTKADWNNTRLIKEDLVTSVRRLKNEPGSDITILGSGSIVTQLADAGLIDAYGFMIDPVALGEGVPLFKGMKNKLDLKLNSSNVFKSGVIMVTYEPIKQQ